MKAIRTAMVRRTFIPLLCCAFVIFSAAISSAQDSSVSRPNILLILADDLGYSDLGCYGGEIQTPNLDRLAQNGLRFTQMYNSARCCPSRASLLTGLYPHQAGIGNFVGNRPDAPAGYRGALQPNAVTIAEVLKKEGYRTFMTGKWHVNDPVPTNQGFDEFYGFTHGYAVDSWNPKQMIRLPEQREQPDYDKGEYFSTNALAEQMINFLEKARNETPDQPWFSYVAFSAPHFPVQAPETFVEKYEETYQAGWDRLRRERLKRMKRIGLLSKDVELSPRSSIIIPNMAKQHGVPGDHQQNPAWNEIDRKRQRDLARRMAVYAGMVENMDRNIGRLVRTLKQNGELENTLIFFLSDNGACGEWGPFGFDLRTGMMTSGKRGTGIGGGTPGSPSHVHTGEERQQMGGPNGDGFAYGSGWANLSNTPLREYKMFTHEGGIATPMIVHWPDHIEENGTFYREPTHLFDVMATVVDVTGASYPNRYEGNRITPMEGTSLKPVFNGSTLPERTFVFSHSGNVAIRDGAWKLVAKNAQEKRSLDSSADWQLYRIPRDRTEVEDLSEKRSDRAKRLREKFTEEAWRIGIFPGR